MRAQERLYLTADKSRLVRHGDPKAAFLYAAEGDEIPESAAGKFGIVDGRLRPQARAVVETLHGSNTLASTFEIGGKTVQLGDLVAKAYKRSGLEVAQWNALPDAERDGLIGEVLKEQQAAAGKPEKPETPPTPKPEDKPTPKPAAKKAAPKKAAKKAS